MILALRKTTGRTGRFLGRALAWRAPDRQHAVVAWGLVAGAAWLAVGLPGDPAWPEAALAGFYLVTILAAICAIDARYGIIPDSLVAALAAGGLLQTYLAGQAGLLERGFEVVAVFAAAALFRASYRWIRGFDGLGFGDVKFVAAAALWIGIAGVPVLLLMAVLSALLSLLIMRAEGYKLDGQQAISFGPHLAVALWLTWIAGPLPFGL
ncbi:A24 family peptidase [Bradyrhizobium sp. sBnM-33]|uniref:prepilin peptidase n=1 Tax=Bradyrhizobium sp. sBnM-33 TaxID=2831780 RepID=UPI001BCAC9F9|nr:A24 family peptidase [Bradyrhizobium sp. sBnM-33]WOH53710.1 A24 family peptidase [Bradyrhizobium sp. sBnM-33]